MHIRILVTLFFFLFYGFSFSQTNTDTPRYGEGVYTFLKRNNRTTAAHYEQFLDLNKSKLGRNNALIMGRSYVLPPLGKQNSSTNKTSSSKTEKGKSLKNPLYGKKYENFTIKSNELKGTCFFLSSGHGGPDPGSISNVDGRQIHEDEYAYDITLRLARILEENGATVHMIIQDAKDGIRDGVYLANSKTETCMGQRIPLGQKARLKQRSDKINQLNARSNARYKRGVFIHLDSRSKKEQLDVFFYYAPGSTGGRKLANTMNKTFREQYQKHQPNRGFSGTVGARDLYVLVNTAPVGIFAELGNIQNASDRRRFLDPKNRQALAQWLAMGLTQDYRNSK